MGGSGSVFRGSLRYLVDDEEAGDGLFGGYQSQAELLLKSVEESGATGVASAIVRAMSRDAGKGSVGVIAGMGGFIARPAEGNIVLARKPGFVVDRETDLI